MKKRSISDKEISLIKAMLARGMKNKEIQFFFNRPDRPVNSGRITGISKGTYSNSARIAPADDTVLDDFLANFKATGVSASVSVPSATSFGQSKSPTDHDAIKALFVKDKDGIWRFNVGESDRHECKENFGFKHADKWLRAVAALANNAGGYVVFGVKDKTITGGMVASDSYQVLGMGTADFENADPADFTKKLKATFDPTPHVHTTSIEIEGMKVGVIYVHQHSGRPVIAVKNEGQAIKEGDIYFRYPGQSARIKYSDLRTILDGRDRVAREQILPMVEKLLSLGPQNAMVADLASGTLADANQSLMISEDLLERIKFIREGEFREESGAPTLRLIGDVKPVDSSGAVIRKGIATPADLLQDFLEQKSPYDPKEYIRCAVELGNGAWLPMHYFARKAELNRNELAEFILATDAPPKRRQLYADRATGKDKPYQKAGGSSADFLEQLMKGTIPKPETESEAASLARAVMGLEDKPPVELTDLLSMLQSCRTTLSGKPGLSYVRKAIAQIDELYFASAS